MFSDHRSALAQVNTIKMSGPVWAAMATSASWQPAELGFLNHGCWLIDDWPLFPNTDDTVEWLHWNESAWKVGLLCFKRSSQVDLYKKGTKPFVLWRKRKKKEKFGCRRRIVVRALLDICSTGASTLFGRSLETLTDIKSPFSPTPQPSLTSHKVRREERRLLDTLKSHHLISCGGLQRKHLC